MVLEKLNLLNIKLNDKATQKVEDQIQQDNNVVDAQEADDRASSALGSLKSLINITNSASSQLITNKQKRQFKERDKRRRSAGRNILTSMRQYMPNLQINSLQDMVNTAKKSFSHRMVSLSSGKFMDTVFAFFSNGREVNQLA